MCRIKNRKSRNRSFNYCYHYFIVPAIKTEVDHENRKLQAEVASLERERARIVSEVDRLKEDLERTKAKLVDKKSTLMLFKV